MNAPPLRFTVIAFLVVLLLSGAAVAVSVTSGLVSPVDVGHGEVTNSTTLIVESQRLTYTGTNVSGAAIVVNNTGTTDASSDISLTLKAANGAVVAQRTKTDVSITANGTTTVTISLSDSIERSSFFWWQITVTRT